MSKREQILSALFERLKSLDITIKRNELAPQAIECSYDFQGAKEQELGKMMTVTLVNDVESY